MIHGLVERPLIFTVDDIRRFPAQSEKIHFLECSGKPRLQSCEGQEQDGLRSRRASQIQESGPASLSKLSCKR